MSTTDKRADQLHRLDSDISGMLNPPTRPESHDHASSVLAVIRGLLWGTKGLMGWLMGWLMGSTSSWVDGRGRVVGSVVVSSSNMSMAASRSGSTASSCGAGCCVGGCGAAGTWAGCCGLCLLVGGDRSKSRSRRSGSKSRRVSISSWSCCCWSCCCCCCWCCSSRGRVRGRVSGWRSLGSQLSWKSAMGGAGWCWVVLGGAGCC